MQAAEAVCAPPLGDTAHDPAELVLGERPSMVVLDHVEALVGKSLVQRELDGGPRARFTMLETLREYALERLREAGEEDEARHRHARYYLHLAESAAPHLRGPEQLEWLQQPRGRYDARAGYPLCSGKRRWPSGQPGNRR